jgi:hypothetical protein
MARIYSRSVTEIMPIQTQTVLIEKKHPEYLSLLLRRLPKLRPETAARVSVTRRYPSKERMIP